MSKIWHVGCTHYGHRNISGKEESTWKSGYRHFKSTGEMNYTLVEQINKYVKPEDTLYHYGDFAMGGIGNIWKFRSKLNVNTIHLMYGNHDEHIKANKTVSGVMFDPIGQIIDGTLTPDLVEDGYGEVRFQDIFTSVHDVLEFKIGNQNFFGSHYPHLSWNHDGKGTIMLHSHNHGSLNQFNEQVKRLDVGIDSAYMILGEFRPFSHDEVLEINKFKNVKGHH